METDFKNLWQKQTVSPPNMDELLSRLKKFKNAGLRNIVVANILLLATSISILWIWYYFEPQFISTKIGIVITILAMVVYLFSYNKQFSLLSKIDNTQTNSDYIQNLTALKNRQKIMETKMLSLYFIMLSVGIGLYMYEYTSRMTGLWAAVAYGVTLSWIGLNWFYIRPKIIKRQRAKIDELIRKFELVSEQLSGE